MKGKPNASLAVMGPARYSASFTPVVCQVSRAARVTRLLYIKRYVSAAAAPNVRHATKHVQTGDHDAQRVTSINSDLLSYLFQPRGLCDKQPIFVDTMDVTRYHDAASLKRLTRGMIAGWKSGLGLSSGFTVTLYTFNNIHYPLMFYGIVGAGGVVAGSNPSSSVQELIQHLLQSKSDYIITERSQLPKVLEAATVLGIQDSRIFLLDGHNETTNSRIKSWKWLLQFGEADWTRFQDGERSSSTTLALLTTSGTTAGPKLVRRTNKNFISECESIADRAVKPYTDRRLLCLPCSHAYANPLCITTPLRYGTSTYSMSRFDLDTFTENIQRYQVTETALVPSALAKIVARDSPEQRQRLSSLRTLYCSGGRLTPELHREVIRSTNEHLRIRQLYGLSESGWVTGFIYPETDDTGSVGRPLGDYRVRVSDEFGHVLEGDESGQLEISGSGVFPGYLGNDAATASAFTSDGWLRTGDLVSIRGGKVYLIDRVKDMIKVNGWTLSPTEIESALVAHPDVLEAAVIGVQHPKMATEIPRAYLVLRSGSSLSAEQAKEFLYTRLAHYKVKHLEFNFCESIPKTSAGKIFKRPLRERARREISDCNDP